MNIYFTFDYELFVNDHTGDIDHCLIIPTNELMKMFGIYNVKATFFIDMAYAYRMKELMNTYPALKIDYDKFCSQVKEIAQKGHKIALHLHPQWFYAGYDGNEFIMDFDHYKLSDMPLKEADSKFDECYKMLCDISGTKVDSFRAGGFSIQEYKGFSDALARNGIIKDSSALFGEKQITSLHSYDYSTMKSPEIFQFSENILEADECGKFTEYPIATRKMSIFRYILYKLQWRFFKNPDYNPWGKGGDNPERRKAEFRDNVKRRFIDGVRVFASVDGHFVEFLPNFIKEYKNKGVNNITILGHPKLASKASIANIEKFIVKYKNRVNFSTI